MSEKLKNGTYIIIGLAVSSYWSNSILHNFRTAWPTKFLMPFFSVSDNLLQDAYTTFQKKKGWFWESAQNMLNFVLQCSFPLNHHQMIICRYMYHHTVHIWSHNTKYLDLDALKSVAEPLYLNFSI